ncbi:MAG: hypothetical protein ACWGHH_02180 [Sulfurovaceae bacterium]
MKYVLSVLVLLSSFIGCKGKISDDTNKSSNNIQLTQAQLQKTKPISNKQFKELLSDTMGDYKRVQTSIGYTGLYSVEMTYIDNDKKILISIVDGVGKEGSNLMSLMRQSIDSNIDIKNQSGYIKSTTIEGIKTIKEETKSENGIINKLTMIISGRFLLTIVGTNVDMDELEEIIEDERLVSKLQNLSQ